MADASISGRTLGRAAAELVIVIFGVIVALAVDRWSASLDEQARSAEYAERLVLDLQADSVQLNEMISQWEQLDEFGTRFLQIVDGADPGTPDPAEFVGWEELMGWWTAFAPNRGTWDELASTGQLELIEDRELRSELTAYYSALDNFARIESRWAPGFQELWARQQEALPPLVVMSGLDAMQGIPNDRAPTMDDVDLIIDAYRRDPALLGAFGRAVMIYRYGAPFLDRIRARSTATLRLARR